MEGTPLRDSMLEVENILHSLHKMNIKLYEDAMKQGQIQTGDKTSGELEKLLCHLQELTKAMGG